MVEKISDELVCLSRKIQNCLGRYRISQWESTEQNMASPFDYDSLRSVFPRRNLLNLYATERERRTPGQVRVGWVSDNSSKHTGRGYSFREAVVMYLYCLPPGVYPFINYRDQDESRQALWS